MVLFKGTNQSQARSAQWVRFPTSQLPLQLNLQKEQVKPEEIRSLIQTRGEMNDKFQSVNGRMVLWEGISVSMLNQGISRTPAQCKSLWTSLVQKYKVDQTVASYAEYSIYFLLLTLP
jgi:hypothetical protein